MCDALTRLRDLSEKRVAPACQRLHLLLQEVQGWAALYVSVVMHCLRCSRSSSQASIRCL